MAIRSLSAAFLGLAVLSGCGSESGSGPALQLFEDTENSIDAAFATGGYTNFIDMPTGGSATYNGYVAAVPSLTSNTIDIGAAQFNVDFGVGSVKMSSSGFERYSGLQNTNPNAQLKLEGDVSGSLSMSDGSIPTGGFGVGAFDGTMTGTVGGTNYILLADGYFIGANAEALEGSASGVTAVAIFGAVR